MCIRDRRKYSMKRDKKGIVRLQLNNKDLFQFGPLDQGLSLIHIWPRLSPTSIENNSKTSTWFMRDGSFLRLKQLEIGYTQ